MKKNFLHIIIVLLLLVNAGTLALLWFGTPGRPPMGRSRGGAEEFLQHQLSLDTRQMQTLETLMETHRNAVMPYRKKINALRDSLFALIPLQNVADASILSYSAKIAACQEQIDILAVRHFQQIRTLCTPAQQKKFDEIFMEVVKLMGPRPGPPPGNPARHHGPPPGVEGPPSTEGAPGKEEPGPPPM